MDLLDYREKYGRAALREVSDRAGIKRNYLAQLIGGFRRMSIEKAESIALAASEVRVKGRRTARLDVISLMRMADRVRAQKTRKPRLSRSPVLPAKSSKKKPRAAGQDAR